MSKKKGSRLPEQEQNKLWLVSSKTVKPKVHNTKMPFVPFPSEMTICTGYFFRRHQQSNESSWAEKQQQEID